MSNEGSRRGGKIAAENMSAGERKARASRAAHARWSGKNVPVATHEGFWKTGQLNCAVLEDGRRVFSERSLSVALEHVRSGSEYARQREVPEEERLPVFITSTVADYLSDEARAQLAKPIRYRTLSVGVPAKGIEASLLPEICDAYLAAREAGALKSPVSLRKAQAAERLLRALSKLGAIALVDEVTGYQFSRERDELQKLLEQFIVEEYRPWSATFPDEFYTQMFRLRNVKTNDVRRRPAYFGHLTNDVVYARLMPGVLERLREVNPSDEGRRKRRHHQHFADGDPHEALKRHIAGVVMLMKSSDNWNQFMGLLDKSSPKQTPVAQLDPAKQEKS